MCYMCWTEFEKRLKQGTTLDSETLNNIQKEAQNLRNILRVIMDVILYCAKNNLALRGSTENIGESDCGVFLSTLELISHYHP